MARCLWHYWGIVCISNLGVEWAKRFLFIYLFFSVVVAHVSGITEF